MALTNYIQSMLDAKMCNCLGFLFLNANFLRTDTLSALATNLLGGREIPLNKLRLIALFRI